MLIQLKNMVECLRNMHKSQSQEYQQQLKEICLNPVALLNFKVILSDPTIECTIDYKKESTKKMGAVFFKNYFVERYCDFEQVFFIQLVMSIIMDEKLSYKYKILMEETIVNMLEWIEKENLCQVINCIENAFQCLQRASGQQTPTIERRALQKKTNLDPTRLDLSKYYKFQLQSQEAFLNLGYSMIHFVQCFTSASTVDIEDLHRVVRISLCASLSIFPMKNTEVHLRLQMVILHMWLGYAEFIQNQKENKKQLCIIQEEIFEEKLLWDKIIETYEFAAFNFTNVQTQDRLLVCSSQEPHKKIINKMKNYACQIHLKMLVYECQQTEELTVLNKTISPLLFTKMIKTLSFFSMQKPMLQSCSCQEFINSLLSLFIFVSQQSPEIIESNWANLLHMIIFPLLTMDEKEFLNFDQDPEEFCRLAEDCCDKQHLGELKTQAARFLQILCDRNFTYCQYVVQFCIVSLQAAVLKNEIKLSNTMSLLPLQGSFLMLTVLSYNLVRFKLQMSTIKTILLTPQCLNLTEIQASRVFLFLAYNYSQMFKNPLQGKAWINFAMNANMHYTTKIVAFDFLLNIVDEYFEEQFMVELSSKLTTEVEIRQVWTILNKLLNNHLDKISSKAMCTIIQNVLERMSTEITKYKDKKVKTTANVNSGLELMRKILSHHNYTATKPQVLQQIYKVVPLYKTFKELNLEDVILKIINEFISREDKLPELFENMLPELMEEFRQQDYRPTAFYWIWNQFIFKEQSFDRLRDIKSLLLQGLNRMHEVYVTEKKRTQSNLPIAHTLLLLQHLMMLHGEKFSKQQVFEIYHSCKSFLPEDINEPQRLNLAPIIIGRVLIVLLICHMLKKDEQDDEGNKTNALKYLLLFHDQDGVFIGQNAEVIVKLLCKELFRQADPVSVTEMINIMVRILRPQLKQQPKNKPKSKSKKAINSLHFKIKSKENYEMILKKIQSPFSNKTTGQQQLKSTLTTMKQNNEFLYKSIISYLPTQIKEKLRDLLATNTLGTQENERTRRILKIGGAKTGRQSNEDEDESKQSKKRLGNFTVGLQSQVYEQIDENQLMLQNPASQTQEDEDKKRKMKKNKLMKKLKKDEKHEKFHNQY